MKTFLIATPDDPEFEKTQRDARAAFAGRASATQPSTPKPIARPATPAAAAPVPAAAAPAPAPQPSDFPPENPKVPRKIMTAFLRDVTLIDKTKTGGAKFFKLNGSEGESWITFSETVATNAKAFAAKGVQLQVAVDMQPRGPVAVGVRPA